MTNIDSCISSVGSGTPTVLDHLEYSTGGAVLAASICVSIQLLRNNSSLAFFCKVSNVKFIQPNIFLLVYIISFL